MRILYATAELSPVAAVGGLANAAAGLVAELRDQGADVETALPDYAAAELEDEVVVPLDVPSWAAPATARSGVHRAAGPLTLVSVPGIGRPDPYVDEHGEGWPDNDRRFLGFSMAVAALARTRQPDVVHVNDWHAGAALAALEPAQPSVLSIHNIAFQGWTGPEWAARIGPRGAAYLRGDACNPLAGALALAHSVVVVSPTFREEILRPGGGFGLDDLLHERAAAVVGIRNGIDASEWDPAADPYLPAPFDAGDLAPKAATRAAALAATGLSAGPGPLAVVVSRLAEQKGIDLLLPLVPELETAGARLAVLGSGSAAISAELRAAAALHQETLAFVEGYDRRLSHLLIAGGDLLLMPSRFEPCGLTQMQAMRYGTLPVVTDVGGLHDTVVDLDDDPAAGTGWKAPEPTSGAVADAVRRATRGWADPALRAEAQRRGMSADWSWREPAARHLELYRRIAIA
jgi:starch synthase